MIFFLVTRINTEPVQRFLAGWGKPLRPWVRMLQYHEALQPGPIRAGTYLFCDVDLLSHEASKRASLFWDALSQAGLRVRTLNHPVRSMRRFELLRTLYEEGINSFNVYRVSDRPRPERFPVFVREEHLHRGSLTELLDGQQSLDAAVEELVRKGQMRENLLAVEFCNTAGPDGFFRKYAAFRIGERIIPRHLFFGENWIMKHSFLSDAELEREERHRAQLTEELHYMETNPHEEQLKQIFELARIEYGRIDYGMLNGRIQVWEINTNPQIVARSDRRGGRQEMARQAAQQTLAALQAIDVGEFGYSISSRDF